MGGKRPALPRKPPQSARATPNPEAKARAAWAASVRECEKRLRAKLLAAQKKRERAACRKAGC